MAIMVGSARRDEQNKYNGVAGDQTQKYSTNDTVGEVSMQEMYTHSKGWLILRPKSIEHAKKIAERMETACNNKNIGYSQTDRYGIGTYGIDTKVKTNCDCSSLVRQCVKEATGKDPGDFTTLNEADKLEATGLFETVIIYVSQDKTPVFDGDILVTKTKGHTVIVVSGNPRKLPKTTVTYTSHCIPKNKWGSEIVGYNLTNTKGYSGFLGNEIDKVAIKLSEGTITYTAHRNGKWGNEIHGYSTTDTNNYAGSTDKPIDAIAIKAEGINGTLKYRVHRKPDNKWGNWITGYSLTDTNKYAGSFGKEIDAIQIGIE